MAIQIDKVVVATVNGQKKIYVQHHMDGDQQPLYIFSDEEINDNSSDAELKQEVRNYLEMPPPSPPPSDVDIESSQSSDGDSNVSSDPNGGLDNGR